MNALELFPKNVLYKAQQGKIEQIVLAFVDDTHQYNNVLEIFMKIIDNIK